MTEQQMFRLRVTFKKQGRLALLSHLEIARALERAVRRAGLPFAVSQGYSPHMKIAFGAALPVGVGGAAELFDLQLTNYVAPDEALSALQAASVEDLMVTSCEYIEPKAAAASAAYPISTYRVCLSEPIGALDVPEVIRVVRKKKEKELRVEDFLVGTIEHKGSIIEFALESKPTGSLRPDVFMDACLKDSPAHIVSFERITQRA